MQKLSKELVKKLIYEALDVPRKNKLTKEAIKNIVKEEVREFYGDK
jgi:hypothetical protein|tara:strand:- start:653 stop:790 length:138 start_codon:yes stop_codon:yes gene_type:complete